MKIDFHVHTDLSDDAGAKVQDIIKTAASKGLDGVVILDHNTMKWDDASIPSETSLKVFRAGEYSTEDGHIIVIGAKTPIEDICSFKNGRFETACIIDEAKRQEAILIMAHPFRWLKKPPSDELLCKMDAIEVYNSRNVLLRNNPNANEKALKAACRLKLPTVSGSDAHWADEVGNSYVDIDTKGATFEIQNLRQYTLNVFGAPSHPVGAFRSQWLKASHYNNTKRKLKVVIKLVIESLKYILKSGSLQSGLIHTYEGVGKTDDLI